MRTRINIGISLLCWSEYIWGWINFENYKLVFVKRKKEYKLDGYWRLEVSIFETKYLLNIVFATDNNLGG